MQNPYQAQRQREEKALAQYVDVLVDTKVNEELLRVKPIQVDGLRGWNKAATKIQAWVRKCQAQRNWPEKQKQLAEEKKRRQERKETAYIPYVLRIQRQYRIYRTINLLRSYKEAKAWRLCWADSVQDQERKASALAENAIEEWSTEQVASWAQGRGLDPTVFITGCISGGILLLLDEMELSELGIKAFTERLKVMIFVKEEVDKLRGQQELERSMSVPLELFLRSPNTPPCSGWYILVEGEKVNGMPLWKRRVGAFWLFSGLRNTWLIGDKQEADEKFNCDTGFLTHPTVHNGVMPQHLKGPWDRFTLRGWAADEMIAFLTPDTIDVLLVDIVRQLQSVWRGKKARHVAAQRKEELRKKQEIVESQEGAERTITAEACSREGGTSGFEERRGNEDPSHVSWRVSQDCSEADAAGARRSREKDSGQFPRLPRTTACKEPATRKQEAGRRGYKDSSAPQR
eukprot:TRINITY_DN8011_c0_g1_i2.p2 TRINITY_DN8011_c0_g1~~TRINITY_DN8011_c0_g1_i2.p2  ORF type:complete len:459 (+),score=120.46 TRINITY_DN8011_c0_g1_i2:166-1542(+)